MYIISILDTVSKPLWIINLRYFMGKMGRNCAPSVCRSHLQTKTGRVSGCRVAFGQDHIQAHPLYTYTHIYILALAFKDK